MAVYAVGDIQGCFQPFQSLLREVNFNPDTDQLWVAGDLVNRGPQSLETLEYLFSIKENVKIVLGNHDLHLLAVYHGVKVPNRKDTLDEILSAPNCDELMDWLIQQPLIQHDKQLGYTMTHAGIPHFWSTKKAIALADEVSSCLNSENSKVFFENMYGNEPDTWSDHLQGLERLRVITNYFTRMRFVAENGQMDFDCKAGPEAPPENMAPWFEFPPVKPRKTKLLFGHWAALEGKTNMPEVIGLDTGAIWGGKLTLMNLETQEIHQRSA